MVKEYFEFIQYYYLKSFETENFVSVRRKLNPTKKQRQTTKQVREILNKMMVKTNGCLSPIPDSPPKFSKPDLKFEPLDSKSVSKIQNSQVFDSFNHIVSPSSNLSSQLKKIFIYSCGKHYLTLRSAPCLDCFYKNYFKSKHLY